LKIHELPGAFTPAAVSQHALRHDITRRRSAATTGGEGSIMHKAADETIQKGLSLGARVALGSVSSLFGLGMILIAPSAKTPVGYYLVGAFCFLIGIACATRGRARQVAGSAIGSIVFLVGVGYLISELSTDGAAGDSSAYDALRYLAYLGLPGAVYAYKVRFGFAKR
jgi:hypothetical protein